MVESKDSWWKRNSFCVSSKKSKDNDKPTHWVGHYKLISLDIDEFFKITRKIDETQASLTDNTEEEENISEKNTYDADGIAEANERIDKNKDKFVTIEEEKMTF